MGALWAHLFIYIASLSLLNYFSLSLSWQVRPSFPLLSSKKIILCKGFFKKVTILVKFQLMIAKSLHLECYIFN